MAGKRKRKDKPWHLKVTWTLSIVMLLLIFGFFYQSFEEVKNMAPVQVAVERIGNSVQEGSKTNQGDQE